MRKRSQDQLEKTEEIQKKMASIPVDYSVYSTEDEQVSDYEVNEDELYPLRGRSRGSNNSTKR